MLLTLPGSFTRLHYRGNVIKIENWGPKYVLSEISASLRKMRSVKKEKKCKCSKCVQNGSVENEEYCKKVVIEMSGKEQLFEVAIKFTFCWNFLSDPYRPSDALISQGKSCPQSRQKHEVWTVATRITWRWNIDFTKTTAVKTQKCPNFLGIDFDMKKHFWNIKEKSAYTPYSISLKRDDFWCHKISICLSCPGILSTPFQSAKCWI